MKKFEERFHAPSPNVSYPTSKWKGRYWVHALASQVLGYYNVEICLFNTSMEEDEAREIAEEFLRGDEAKDYLVLSQTRDTFDIDQVAQIIKWLARWFNFDILVRQAQTPEKPFLGYHGTPVWDNSGWFDCDDFEPFGLRGYFKLDGLERVEDE
jgi:hypothetical protein